MNHPNGSQPGRMLSEQEHIALLAAQLDMELKELVEKNKAGFIELQRRGIGFDPAQIMGARIDKLMESVSEAFGLQGRIWELQARYKFEQFIAEQQAEAGKQGTKAQLAMGGSFTPAMIRQLAAETGFGS